MSNKSADQPDPISVPACLAELGYKEFEAGRDDPLFWLVPGYLEVLGHSRTEADRMIAEYKCKFMNPEYCRTIGITVQDDEFVGHEGPASMATLIHYYIGLRGNPAWDKFIEWCEESQVPEKLWRSSRSES